MAFDPDAYLAARTNTAPGAFDPDAYLARKAAEKHEADKAQVGVLESLLRGAGQSATFNFADELTALGESALGSMGLVPDKTYEQALGESRENYATAREANPVAFGAGEFGGGLAASFVPGMGAGKIVQAAGAGRKILEAGKLGAKFGALSGLGASEDKGIDDVLTGALVGGAGGAGMQGAVSGLGALGRGIAGKVRDGLKPDTQLALALGATSADLNPAKPLAGKLGNATKVLEKHGLFSAPAEGGLDESVLWERLGALKAETGQAIGDAVARHGSTVSDPAEFQKLRQTIGVQLRQIIDQAPPDLRQGIGSKFVQAYDELINTGGKLSDLWKLKANSGHWAHNAWLKAGMPPPQQQGYMAMNRALDDYLINEVGKLGDDTLQALNRTYSAAATVEPLLGKRMGFLEGAPTSLGLSARDLGAGGMLAGMASGVGAGAVAAPLGFAGAAANQYLRSVPGRVARAQAGRTLEAFSQKMSEMTGAIPRTTKGAQEWLRKNMQVLPPQMQQTAAAIVGAPPDRAQQMLRAVIPVFAQHFAKSKFPSELDGTVSSDDDKMAIRQELMKLQLPATHLALKLSALNKQGTIPVEVYDPDDDYGDEMMQFAAKMMGGAF